MHDDIFLRPSQFGDITKVFLFLKELTVFPVADNKSLLSLIVFTDTLLGVYLESSFS